MMQTITLKVDDSISDKLQWLLSHFSSSEIEIVKSIDVSKLSQDDFDYIAEDEMKQLKKISNEYKKGKRDDFEEYML